MKRFFIYVLPIFLLTVACSESQDNEPEPPVSRIKVATYNVDGLPVSVSVGIIGKFITQYFPQFPIEYDEEKNVVVVNSDGPGVEGSIRIGEKIRERGWDVFGFNEDFNYHYYILKSLEDYSCGTHMGMIDGDLYNLIRKVLSGRILFDIDGLEIGVRNTFTLSGEVIRPWIPEAVYGYFTNCQDSLATKGFRYYQVTNEEQTTIDFIVLHADAGDYRGDILAREAAFQQLYDFITVEITSGNPLVIMGDFNCKYWRDRMKELFIDRLNAVPGLEASDVWVEKLNGGVFPEYIYPDTCYDTPYVPEKVELLDKIVYVNRSDSPVRLRLESVTNVYDFVGDDGKQLADHYPLEAEFVIERN